LGERSSIDHFAGELSGRRWRFQVAGRRDVVRYRDRYLFDLQGYLTLPDALSAEKVEQLNEVIDGLAARDIGREETTRRWFHLLAQSRAFRDLIDNPPVLPILEELLGKEFRLDHEYVDLIRSGMGPIGTGLHGGAVPFRPIEYYWNGGGQLHSGLVAVAYNLKRVGPDDGGFACVPGSHKSAFAFPDNWKDLSDPQSCVRRVTGPAGSAIIFTEALVHGTLPWRGSDERRTVFYKYSPRPLAWSRTFYNPAEYPDLTEQQRDILRSPGIEHV
jgi:hypothetical protein